MTQIFNRGGSLRYDMKGKKVRIKQVIGIRKTERSIEVLKKSKENKEGELAKDFFERLKKSVGNTAKQETKVYSGRENLWASQRCISLMQWQYSKMIKNLQKISQKCEDKG